MKYIEIAYKPGGTPYTYHCEDDSIEVGDTVRITLNSGATMEREVLSVTTQNPGRNTSPATKA